VFGTVLDAPVKKGWKMRNQRGWERVLFTEDSIFSRAGSMEGRGVEDEFI